MTRNVTARPGPAQVPSDFLDAMLLVGRAPTLKVLMALAPFEQLGPPETVGCWPQSVVKLHKQFLGYQPGYHYGESLKYAKGLSLTGHEMPREGAPMASFVRKRLQHALAKWSSQIGANRTSLQFVDWLPLHLDFQTVGDGGPLWPDGDGGWGRSYQLLRLACGLPRFPRPQGRVRY